MIILFILFSLSNAAINCLMMTGGRDSLLSCFSTYVDTNHDGSITPSELSYFFLNTSSIGRDFSTRVFRKCDYNHDNQLTIEDWNAPDNFKCGTNVERMMQICRLCERLGWTVPMNETRK